MGTTRIKVIDLSQEVEQVKTSRKRAVKGLIGEIKSPLVEKKKVKPKVREEKVQEEKAGQEEELISEEKAKEESKIKEKKTKFVRTRSQNYQGAKSKVDPQIFYPIEEALDLAKKTAYTKFDASLETHVILKNKKPIRGHVVFPHRTAKERKVLVFAQSLDGLAKNGVILGDEKTIEKIARGELKPQKDFDLIISTPDFMPKLATIGKTLGPKGLMPNPKSGTVVENPKEALVKLSEGQIEFRSEEKSPVVHLAVGKVSQDVKKLKENFMALLLTIGIARIKKVVISPTMGPGIKVDIASIVKGKK